MDVKIKIALLDGQTIQAISIAKQLKKSGYFVILLCDTKFSYGYHSRYADKKVICPPTKNNFSKYHNFLLNFIRNEKVNVLFPMNDDSAKYLSVYKEELSYLTKFIIPSYEVFKRGYDKNELMKVCSNNSIPHPKTFDLSKSISELIKNQIVFPALIKPNETTGARGFVLVNSIDEVQEKLPKIELNYGKCHLQEFIKNGRQYKVEIFIYEGKVVNSTVILKKRFYPINGGSSCFNKTIFRDDLVNMCFKVLQAIKWDGFADFDLIEDPRDMQCKIMEINPRVPASIKASFISGVDFSKLIVEASLNQKFTTFNYMPDKYLRYLGLDLLWFLSSKNKREMFSIWNRKLFSKDQYLQDGSWDEPLPFLVGSIASVLKQLNPNFRASKKGMNN